MQVTFSRARPGPRSGDNAEPFITVEFWASPSGVEDTFVQRDSQALTPVDTDPGDPQYRTLSTDLGQDGDRFWRLVFVDADDNEDTTEIADRLRIRPTVEDVGSILHARTRSDDSGAAIGTFDTTTDPTGAVVAGFIDSAVLEVQMRLGIDDLTDPLDAYARKVICNRVAMDIELSYTPDQADADTGAYEKFRGRDEAGITQLTRRLAQADGGPRRGARVRTLALVSPDGLNDPDPFFWWQ